MKTVIAIVAVLLLSLLQQLPSTNACDCISTPTPSGSLKDEDIDYVFRGYVKRTIDIGTVSINEPKYFDVRIWRVYKGCSFTNGTSIVLTTAGNSGLCGLNLEVGKNYVFSGSSQPMKSLVLATAQKSNPNILANEMVRVALCDFNMNYDSLQVSEKRRLKNYKNVCK